MLGLNHNVGILRHPGFNDLGTAAAAVGIVGGVKSLMSDGGTAGGSAGGGTQAQAPWQLSGFGSEASGYLANLMRGGVGGVMNDPGFQAWNKLGEQGVMRGLAATGQTQSGNERIALNDYNKSSAMTYYDKSLQQLGSLAGVQFGASGAGTNAQLQQGGWDSLAKGLGGLNTIYGNTSGTQRPAPVSDGSWSSVDGSNPGVEGYATSWSA